MQGWLATDMGVKLCVNENDGWDKSYIESWISDARRVEVSKNALKSTGSWEVSKEGRMLPKCQTFHRNKVNQKYSNNNIIKNVPGIISCWKSSEIAWNASPFSGGFTG